MKRVAIVLGAVVAVLLGAFALVWFVPGVQDRIVQSAMTRQIAKAARVPYLTDDGLHILLCGTGSPMPDMTRANACAAVIAGGRVVVIDAGPGAWSRLAAANIPGAKIDTVLLTHLHSDHIGDLGEVATQSWLGGRKVPLEVYGPPAPEPSERTTDAEGETFGVAGTEEVVKGFAEVYNSDAEFRIAQGGELVRRDGLKISAFLVNHDPVEPAYGYRVEYGGRAAVVSGDTARVPNMVRFSKGADVLVHEALNRDMVEMLASALDASGNARAGTMARQVIAYHTSPVEAASIAKEAQVPLLVFTHEVPPLRNGLMRHMFMRGVADARGDGKTVLGKDGLLISLPKGSRDIQTKQLY